MSAVVETGLILTRGIPSHAAVQLDGQPGSNPLKSWDTERAHVEIPAGTRFDILTDPTDVGPPSTMILRLEDGTYYRVHAEYVLRDSSASVFLEFPRPSAAKFYA